MARRKYKSGTQWCFWRWTDFNHNDQEQQYIDRLHLVKTPWFAICIHFINGPDPEPYLHDHPVTFLSLILKGWYTELRPGFISVRNIYDTLFGKWYPSVTRHWFNFIRATDIHTITKVSEGGAITIAFMGPRRQEWGFFKLKGKQYWKDYYNEKVTKTNSRCAYLDKVNSIIYHCVKNAGHDAGHHMEP